MKVMIVDDHVDMRRILNIVISNSFSTPLDIIECESGEEAVLAYKKFAPYVVFMDIELKKMDGFEATALIREQDSKANIIFVSSNDTSNFRAKAKELKATGFVSKSNLLEIAPILSILIKEKDK
jgi:DNA-binding NarL/FixJ family response regulator